MDKLLPDYDIAGTLPGNTTLKEDLLDLQAQATEAAADINQLELDSVRQDNEIDNLQLDLDKRVPYTGTSSAKRITGDLWIGDLKGLRWSTGSYIRTKATRYFNADGSDYYLYDIETATDGGLSYRFKKNSYFDSVDAGRILTLNAVTGVVEFAKLPLTTMPLVDQLAAIATTAGPSMFVTVGVADDRYAKKGEAGDGTGTTITENTADFYHPAVDVQDVYGGAGPFTPKEAWDNLARWMKANLGGIKPPAPTNPDVDDAANTFTYYPSGYTAPDAVAPAAPTDPDVDDAANTMSYAPSGFVPASDLTPAAPINSEVDDTADTFTYTPST